MDSVYLFKLNYTSTFFDKEELTWNHSNDKLSRSALSQGQASYVQPYNVTATQIMRTRISVVSI